MVIKEWVRRSREKVRVKLRESVVCFWCVLDRLSPDGSRFMRRHVHIHTHISRFLVSHAFRSSCVLPLDFLPPES